MDRELLVITANPEPEVEGYIAALGDPSIRCLRAPPETPVGPLRNLGIAAATGEFIAVSDDDDLSHPRRLEWQYEALAAQGGVACVVPRVLLWWPQRRRLAAGVRRTWENTLLVGRSAAPTYSDKVRGSDTEALKVLLARGNPAVAEMPGAYIYVAHGRNLWGDDHFEMLFKYGQEFAPADYPAVISQLGREMPLEAYQRGLGVLR